MAAALKKEPGVQVELVNGSAGELTVSVDGQVVARKGDSMPTVEEVLAAVKKGTKAAVG